jgi:hypothetical protein
MRTTRQCCSGDCNQGRWCEDDAWKQYKEQRMKIYKKMLTNPAVLIIIGAVIGFVIGQLL